MNCEKLSEGYMETRTIDLQKNKKMAIIVNLAAILISLLMVALMIFIKSASDFFETFFFNIPMLLFFILFTILYIVVHELIHALFFKIYGAKKVKFGFTGLYAYASGDIFFDRGSYIVIGLAPVLICGVLFLILNIFLPPMWFWLIYLLQVINLSGAAGDFYVTVLLLKGPKETLIHDYGVSMIFYNKK